MFRISIPLPTGQCAASITEWVQLMHCYIAELSIVCETSERGVHFGCEAAVDAHLD